MSSQLPPTTRQPTTEEDIRKYTVGELKPHAAPILLVDYDPAWPGLFERENARIRAALGERVVQLEHTGSTSVPGLAAKPCIDMTLVVPDSSDEALYVSALEAAGYVLVIREPDWYEHRCLKGPDTNVNLHVYSEGCPEVERNLTLYPLSYGRNPRADRSRIARQDLGEKHGGEGGIRTLGAGYPTQRFSKPSH